MPIPIHQEPDDELTRNTDQENCCFCRAPTPWWTSLPNRRGQLQVACCPSCAARGEPVDVPTKAIWFRRERIAHRPTLRNLAQGSDREYPPAPIITIDEDTDPGSRNPDHMTYIISWSEEDQEFVAICPDFPSLSYLDKSLIKALKGIKKLVSDALSDL